MEWQLLPLSFNLARLTKGLQRWNGSFLFKMLPSGGSQKVCYLGLALRLNFTVRVAHKKRCATSGNKRPATVLHRMYDQISKSPLTRLASKVQTQGPEDQDEGPKDQGPEDQGTRGPRDQRDQGTRGPRDQGTRGPRDQATREPADQDQRSRGNFMFDMN